MYLHPQALGRQDATAVTEGRIQSPTAKAATAAPDGRVVGTFTPCWRRQ